MDDVIKEVLESNAAFVSLDETARNLLSTKFSKIELHSSDILFNQGDPSDCVYFLTSGKLLAQLITSTGATRDIGYIEAGETVGEMGALTTEPRTLTVKALKHSILLKLSIHDFLFICEQYPSVLLTILRPLLTRTSSLIQLLSTGKRHKHIVIVPANRHVSLQGLSGQLQDIATEYPNMLLVSDYQPIFHDSAMTANLIKEKITGIVQERKSTKTFLYLLSASDTALAKYALKRADIMYVAAHHDSAPRIDKHILEKINQRKLLLSSGPRLILLYNKEIAMPKNTINWLKTTEFTLHHHVRLYRKKDIQRLVRFIRGKAVGVVLSGGGTRGWAHLGALKALSEAKIPIDIIGGTSVGALVAGCYASNKTYADAYAVFNRVVITSAHSIAWRSLVLPVISLFSAKNYTKSQQDAFGDQTIEDLWIPYFCVTSNLANNTESIHQSGKLWEKIRASTAIPGLLPPMLLDSELHVDGGLINNFPVDIMRKFVGHHARVIAVELNSFSPDKNKYLFPPVVTLWESILIKLGLKKSTYVFPKFIDTFMHSIFVGSELRSRQNALSANLSINLNLGEFSVLRSNPEEGLRLIQMGYDETIKQLGKAKNR